MKISIFFTLLFFFSLVPQFGHSTSPDFEKEKKDLSELFDKASNTTDGMESLFLKKGFENYSRELRLYYLERLHELEKKITPDEKKPLTFLNYLGSLNFAIRLCDLLEGISLKYYDKTKEKIDLTELKLLTEIFSKLFFIRKLFEGVKMDPNHAALLRGIEKLSERRLFQIYRTNARQDNDCSLEEDILRLVSLDKIEDNVNGCGEQLF